MKIYRNNNEEKFYIEDGIIEFKDNTLSILTSSVVKLDQINKSFIDDSIKEAEKKLTKEDITDQQRFLISQKIDTLKSIGIN